MRVARQHVDVYSHVYFHDDSDVHMCLSAPLQVGLCDLKSGCFQALSLAQRCPQLKELSLYGNLVLLATAEAAAAVGQSLPADLRKLEVGYSLQKCCISLHNMHVHNPLLLYIYRKDVYLLFIRICTVCAYMYTYTPESCLYTSIYYIFIYIYIYENCNDATAEHFVVF
jgi:hypothetical protein